MKLFTPKPNQQFGCPDQSPPVNTSMEKLSRMYDALFAANEAGLNIQDVFKLFSSNEKLEFNYSCWQYQPKN